VNILSDRVMRSVCFRSAFIRMSTRAELSPLLALQCMGRWTPRGCEGAIGQSMSSEQKTERSEQKIGWVGGSIAESGLNRPLNGRSHLRFSMI